MAGAHVCMKCGTDMTRCRAVDDPHYGLPLVFCPECGWACARHVHRINRRRRKLLKAGSAIALLILQVLLVFLLTMVNLTNAFVFSDLRMKVLDPEWMTGNLYFLVWMFLIGPILTGIWLVAGLRQIRWWKAYVGWSLWIAAWITWLTLGMTPYDLDYSNLSMSEIRSYLDVMEIMSVPVWKGNLVIYMWMMIPTIVFGIPAGLWFLKLQRRNVLRRWTKMRQKRIKRRQAS